MGRRGFFRLGLAVSLVWLLFNLFPLWWVVVTAFKPPLAVSQGATYIPFVDFQPTLQAFGAAPDLDAAVARMVRVGAEIVPDPAWTDLYDRMMPIHVRLYEQSKGFYDDLDAL